MYPIGQQQAHPLSPFGGHVRECSVEVAGASCVFNTDAIISTTWKMIEAPVSHESKTGSESEPIEDTEFEEGSRSASVVSDDSIHDVKNIESIAFGTLDAEIEPTCDDVLIGTGRTCSSHEGNKRFHREIYDSCEEYFLADYKKGIVEKIIKSVHRRGGRFLAATKKGPWFLVVDMDRLERNTRKSFHMAKKQREKELQLASSSQKVAALTDLSPQLGQQVAVYVREARSFCTGWIEKKRANGELFVRFSDRRLGAQWLNVVTTDIRILSR
ncbi:hypothetical protein FisN_7Lh212 [Fistulifera solaris]|uniref:DUF6824 domain-containing protein n=1 Tax=Fistulifera solaris TaxID=1519565 RepID=A0A1Z5JRG8_FISSO|nr:hypothetical protein FisN_7Lh212 [Fistulifera solaris]|eukprot:GAX16496.1 hypothetical protein FisN_7Lh212 [Fistulifera solaris]